MPESFRDWLNELSHPERIAHLKLWANLDLDSPLRPAPCHGRVNGHDCPLCAVKKRTTKPPQPWDARRVVSLDAYRDAA